MAPSNLVNLPKLKFAIFGLVFGTMFPIAAYILDAAHTNQSVWSTFLLHENPAFVITDLAPFVLGVFAYVIGLRDSRLKALTEDRTRARLEEAELVGQYGSWEMDLQTFEVKWSNGLYHLYGLDPSHPPSYEKFLEIVHPDDRELVQQNTDKVTREKPATFENEVRIIARDTGSIRHFRSRGAFINQSSNGWKIVGTTHDVTELVEAKRLAFETLKAKSELEAVSALIVTYKHEINNPLAIAMTSLELIEDNVRNHRNIVRASSALLRISEILKSADQIVRDNSIEYAAYANSDIKMVRLKPKPK